MDNELKLILAQIIDNQLSLNKKIEELILLNNNLFNLFVKYDNEYQNELAKGEE